MKINIVVYCFALFESIYSLRIKQVHNLSQVNNTNKTNETNTTQYTPKNQTNETFSLIAKTERKDTLEKLYSIVNDSIIIRKTMLDEKEFQLITNMLEYISDKKDKERNRLTSKDNDTFIYHPHLVDTSEIISYIKEVAKKPNITKANINNSNKTDNKEIIYEVPSIRKLQIPKPLPMPRPQPNPQTHITQQDPLLNLPKQEEYPPQNMNQHLSPLNENKVVTKEGIVTNSIQHHNNDVILVSEFEKPLPSLKPNPNQVKNIPLPALSISPMNFLQKSVSKKVSEKEQLNNIMLNYYYNTE